MTIAHIHLLQSKVRFCTNCTFMGQPFYRTNHHHDSEATVHDVLQHMCSSKYCKIHRKTPVLESFLIKLQAFRPEKRLQHICFLVNVANCLKTAFLQNFPVASSDHYHHLRFSGVTFVHNRRFTLSFRVWTMLFRIKGFVVKKSINSQKVNLSREFLHK